MESSIDREKVIKGLAVHLSNKVPPCDECPYANFEDARRYNDPSSCSLSMMADALALLKDQEPRVMKLEDVKAFGWDYCYLEEERLPGKEYRSVCGDYALTCITWPCIASMRIQHGDDSYGKKWRCWSAKPTDEQRQAVKWE